MNGGQPMHSINFKTLTASFVALLLAAWLAGPAASAPRSAIPRPENCELIELRHAGGWWLQLRRNEPASYGFGALPVRVIVKEQTFSFEEIYRDTIDAVGEAYPGAPVTIMFSPMAAGYEDTVFALNVDPATVSQLFATAYRGRDQSLDDGFQQQAIRRLDRFLTSAPFLE